MKLQIEEAKKGNTKLPTGPLGPTPLLFLGGRIQVTCADSRDQEKTQAFIQQYVEGMVKARTLTTSPDNRAKSISFLLLQIEGARRKHAKELAFNMRLVLHFEDSNKQPRFVEVGRADTGNDLGVQFQNDQAPGEQLSELFKGEGAAERLKNALATSNIYFGNLSKSSLIPTIPTPVEPTMSASTPENTASNPDSSVVSESKADSNPLSTPTQSEAQVSDTTNPALSETAVPKTGIETKSEPKDSETHTSTTTTPTGDPEAAALALAPAQSRVMIIQPPEDTPNAATPNESSQQTVTDKNHGPKVGTVDTQAQPTTTNHNQGGAQNLQPSVVAALPSTPTSNTNKAGDTNNKTETTPVQPTATPLLGSQASIDNSTAKFLAGSGATFVAVTAGMRYLAQMSMSYAANAGKDAKVLMTIGIAGIALFAAGVGVWLYNQYKGPQIVAEAPAENPPKRSERKTGPVGFWDRPLRDSTTYVAYAGTMAAFLSIAAVTTLSALKINMDMHSATGLAPSIAGGVALLLLGVAAYLHSKKPEADINHVTHNQTAATTV